MKKSMKTILQGDIEALEPVFHGGIDSDGNLEIGEKLKDIHFTVDTGFSYGIALPKDLLKSMEVNWCGYETFILGTGDIVELPVYTGKVIINTHKIKCEIET